MTTDGGLDRWGSSGPVVWHSETSGLDYWGSDGVWSDFVVGDSGAIEGVLTKTLSGLSLSAAGMVEIKGQAAPTLAGLSLAAAAKLDISGQAARSLAALALSSAGKLTVSGSVSAQFDTLNLIAICRYGCAGSVDVVLGALTLSADGAWLRVIYAVRIDSPVSHSVRIDSSMAAPRIDSTMKQAVTI